MKLIPLNNSVIVIPKKQQVQENALFCSQPNMGEVQLATVESSNNINIKTGEDVVFFKYCACPYTLNSKNYLIINADDCLAIIKENENE